MITDEKEREDDVTTAGWSICESDETNDYSMALYHFAVTNLDGSAEAGRFLTNYIKEYGGTALTDFDEVQPSIMGAFPITEIVKGIID